MVRFLGVTQNHLEAPQSRGLLLIFTPNPEILVQIEENPELKTVLESADILLPDGIGLLLANRWIRLRQRLLFLFKQPLMPAKIREKMAGVELADKLLIEAAKKNYVSLIIGGRDYASFWGKQGGEYQGEIFEDEQSLIKLKKNLYWTEAYQDKDEPLPIEDEAIERILKKLNHKLFLALGSLDQEEWLVRWRALGASGVAVAIGVGVLLTCCLARGARAWFLS